MYRFFLTSFASAALALTPVASAEPITYTFTGTFSGSVRDADTFDTVFDLADDEFILTIEADTDNIAADPTGFSVTGDLATFTFPDINGGTSTQATTSFDVFVNNTNGVLGVGNADFGIDLLFFSNPAFTTYDLSTPLSTVTPDGFAVIDESAAPINTDLGELLFVDDFDPALSFTAVPEPTSLAMLGLGGVICLRRRHT